MTGEYPYLCHRRDFPDAGYDGVDGVIEPGMVICVERYTGGEGGIQGVKLEQQVLLLEQALKSYRDFHSRKLCCNSLIFLLFPHSNSGNDSARL